MSSGNHQNRDQNGLISFGFEDNFVDLINNTNTGNTTTVASSVDPFDSFTFERIADNDTARHNYKIVSNSLQTNSSNSNTNGAETKRTIVENTVKVGKSNFYNSKSTENLVNTGLQTMALDLNFALPSAARDSIIRSQMIMAEDQYTQLQSFRIFIASWNVNGQSPTVSLGEHWLATDPSPPDIYAIGFQELDLSKEAFLFNDTPREEEWYKACKHGLHPNADYQLVKLVRLIGMMLIVFIKKELTQFVQNVCAETVGTGILGKMGNKGGVAVRFDFHNSSLCFVNCHLAAHVDEFERRNQDYSEINSRLVFNQCKPQKFIKDHDHIYWFGDLNYRIMNLNTDQVKDLLTAQAFTTLLEHDQLKIQMGFKNVFVGFTEGDIKHSPTYKYDTGTDEWDSSEKNRPPAWCDRVLWRGGPTTQIQYRSHSKLKISDHKPVSALFNASIKVVDSAKYRRIYENVMKELDKRDNEFLPQVTLSKTEVIFNTASFRDSAVNSVTIANTGQVSVKFEFITKPNDNSYCKEWLRIKPYTAMLIPGDALDIEFELCVDKNTASRLNNGSEKLEEILVLHLDGGKDFFITVSGAYQTSCFGCAIDSLVRLNCPLRQISDKVLQKLEQKQYNDQFPICWDIPKELWILVDQIYKYGMITEELFQQTGLKSDFIHIRDTLDIGWPEKLNASVHSIAEALLIFLEALAEPVIPYNYYHQSLECSNNFILCKQVINELPSTHRHVFYYLIAFLRELLRHSNSNKLDSKIIASIFGTILLRSPDSTIDKKVANQQNRANNLNNSSAQLQATERKKAAFIYHFLVNDFDI